jgi:predicted Ser/Thr protein kinase
MGLAPGTRLGPYEVVALVGAGGMGEVYKARDTRLDRHVALKILPTAVAADPHFRERFEREAKSISALNHPNICTLHDIGRHDEVDFLVMEFLEGETLAARLARGAVPLPDALKIATEIASALDRAHRQGIVHRDLKPGNVMLTKTGAKLLDFGLAKTGLTVAGSALSALPTVSGPLTARGTILGTFQYMAPEQVEGEEADARTDIFAFGALLFELLSGRKAFEGKSDASLLSAILRDQPPPVSQVQPVSPPALDHLVRACLAKDRDDRIQTAHDVVLQLRWIGEGSGATVPQIRPRRKWGERVAWATALAAVSLVAILLAVGRAGPQAAVEPVAFTVETPGFVAFSAQAVSPDGRWLAFARVPPGQRTTDSSLWLRPVGSTQAVPLQGTDNPGSVFWSPDSRSIGFRSEGRLKRMDITTGLTTSLHAMPANLSGGTWGAGGEIIFSTSQMLYRVSATGAGEPIEFLRPDPALYLGFTFPEYLPDQRHVLFFAAAIDPDRTGIYAVDSAATPATTVFVTKSDSAASYAEGRLLFIRDNALLAQPFDARTRRMTGEPVAVARGFCQSRLQQRPAILERRKRAGLSGRGASPDRSGLVRPARYPRRDCRRPCQPAWSPSVTGQPEAGVRADRSEDRPAGHMDSRSRYGRRQPADE